jgi:hypothetical protein
VVVLGDGHRTLGDAPSLELLAHGLGHGIRVLARVGRDLHRVVGERALRHREVRQGDGHAVFLGLLHDGYDDRQAASPHSNPLGVGPRHGLIGQRDEGLDGVLIGGGQLTIQAQFLAAFQEGQLRQLVHRVPRRVLHPIELAGYLTLFRWGGGLWLLFSRGLSGRRRRGRLSNARRQQAQQRNQRHDLVEQFARHIILLVVVDPNE